MPDDVTSQGLLALKLGQYPYSPRYETNQYPAIPEYIKITFRASDTEGFGYAQAFLRQERVGFDLPGSKDSDHILVINGKENTRLLYNILHDFSSSVRQADVGKWLPSSAAVADGLLWHIFGPWLEKALEVPGPKGSLPIMMRQAESPAASFREQSIKLLQGMGLDDARIPQLADNLARVAEQAAQQRALREGR